MCVMLKSRVVNKANFLAFCTLVRPNYLMKETLSELYSAPSVAFSTLNSISSGMSAGRVVMAGLQVVKWAST